MTTSAPQRILKTCPKCGWQWLSRPNIPLRVCPHCSKAIAPSKGLSNTCRQCGYLWYPHSKRPPANCPQCHSVLWGRGRATQHGENYDKVAALRKNNLCADLQDIADKVGISRERVRQILKAQGLPTAHFDQTVRYECLNCGKQLEAGKTKFCNRTCQYEYSNPQVSCTQCGKLFRRPATQLYSHTHARNPRYKDTGVFCSRQCYGKWLGEHHRNGIKRKYDYDFIWAKYLETGLGCSRLSRVIGIPTDIIQAALHKLSREKGVELHYAPVVHAHFATKPRKYDWDMVWAKHLETGLRSCKLGPLLGINDSTVESILRKMSQITSTPRIHPQREHHNQLLKDRIPRQTIKIRWLARLNFTEREVKRMTGCSASHYWRATKS